MAGRSRTMKKHSARSHNLSAAERGHIVQQVIVEGRSIEDVAAASRVSERLVAAWVAGYRRHGMASLRRRPRKSVAAEMFELSMLRPVRAVLRGVSVSIRWLFSSASRPVPPSSIRRMPDDRRGGS